MPEPKSGALPTWRRPNPRPRMPCGRHKVRNTRFPGVIRRSCAFGPCFMVEKQARNYTNRGLGKSIRRGSGRGRARRGMVGAHPRTGNRLSSNRSLKGSRRVAWGWGGAYPGFRSMILSRRGVLHHFMGPMGTGWGLSPWVVYVEWVLSHELGRVGCCWGAGGFRRGRGFRRGGAGLRGSASRSVRRCGRRCRGGVRVACG
jgi:hypothetical protein